MYIVDKKFVFVIATNRTEKIITISRKIYLEQLKSIYKFYSIEIDLSVTILVSVELLLLIFLFLFSTVFAQDFLLSKRYIFNLLVSFFLSSYIESILYIFDKAFLSTVLPNRLTIYSKENIIV